MRSGGVGGCVGKVYGWKNVSYEDMEFSMRWIVEDIIEIYHDGDGECKCA